MGFSIKGRVIRWLQNLVSQRPVAINVSEAPAPRIVFETARLDDPANIARRPGGATVSCQLQNEQHSGVFDLYDNETRTAWWIVSDGEVVHWYGVEGINKQEWIDIGEACRQITAGSEAGFVAAVRGAFRPGVIVAAP